jgi:L-ascorbate metabolism protein UlaG (beta-lactamase superfamily)
MISQRYPGLTRLSTILLTTSGVSRTVRDVIIQRYGHAALLVEVGPARILVDPGNASPDATFALTDLDAILITHQHPDHADPDRLPRLLAASPAAMVLAEAEAIGRLSTLATRATVIAPGDEVRIAGATIRGVGGVHAVIHPEIPAVGNVGVTITAEAEPLLFHPGDSYDVAPPGVDVLALPLSAPWAKLSETIDFARRVAAGTVLPIHDRGLTPGGYPTYWRTLEQLGGPARYEPLGSDGKLEVP